MCKSCPRKISMDRGIMQVTITPMANDAYIIHSKTIFVKNFLSIPERDRKPIIVAAMRKNTNMKASIILTIFIHQCIKNPKKTFNFLSGFFVKNHFILILIIPLRNFPLSSNCPTSTSPISNHLFNIPLWHL